MVTRHASQLQPKICIFGCSIYVIEQSLLHCCWYSRFTDNLRQDSLQQASRTRNSPRNTLCWVSFDPGTQTCACSLVSYIGVWTLRNWHRIWFSDESRFLLQRCDGRTRVYRRRKERLAPVSVQEVDRFGGGSVMMWAARSYKYKTNLERVQGNLTAQRYRRYVAAPNAQCY